MFNRIRYVKPEGLKEERPVLRADPPAISIMDISSNHAIVYI